MQRMKLTDGWLTLVVIGVFAFGGCKKAEQDAGPTSEFYGVKVDVSKLAAEFTNPDQDMQVAVSLIKRDFREEQFPRALLELEKLSKMSILTESQKKLANDLIEQTRQVIAKAPPQPGQ